MVKVLVADDERWIRKGIVRMIEAQRLKIDEIYEADSAAVALELFYQNRPDIVLSDVMFPAENGCDMCEKIYQICPDTCIIMISAFDNFEFARRSIKYKAVDYLLKPVSKEQLNQVLQQCIKQIEERKAGETKESVNLELASQPILDAEPTSDYQIRKIMRHMKDNLTEKYTLADMATECCLSEVYFSNLFKKVSGMSPMNYITQLRIDKAKELIGCTNWKMVTIAQHVGYQDYQYFVKVFKKVAGQTPGEYKAQIQKEVGDV